MPRHLGGTLEREATRCEPADLLRERAASEAAVRRFAFLAEASVALATSLDYETTLQRVARLALPEMADWCVVDTLEEDGAIRLLAVAHVEPAREAVVHELRRRYPPSPHARYGLRKVLRTGQAELYPEILPSWREATARDAEHLRLMDTLDARSSMCVPLLARGQVLGAMTFVCAGSGRRYSRPDLTLAEDLASRCALALDNARLHGELQETLRAREAFLVSVAHDLKNPLTASKGFASMLRRRASVLGKPEGVGRLVEWAAKIEANSTKMVVLIDELLDSARLEAGQSLQLDRRPTDLVALARRVADEHQRLTARHRLSVDTQVPQVVGEWDAGRLERVLDNLLSNAIGYSPDGGEVTIEVAAGGPWAVLTVTDNGLGIPAADLPRIFERFHRGRNVAGQVAGTGIGLTGARQIVEQHGGSVALESQEGKGTAVTVRLPLDASPT